MLLEDFFMFEYWSCITMDLIQNKVYLKFNSSSIKPKVKLLNDSSTDGLERNQDY